MGNVILELTMSLDGITAGPDVSSEYPLGKGGERLHDWMFSAQTDADTKLQDELVQSVGAVLVGGKTYAVGIDAWDGVTPFAAPAFVVTGHRPDRIVSGFTYVTDGIESALKQAKAAARNRNVWIMGGATLAQSYLQAGVVDELHIHIAPVLLGEGTRLFDHIGSAKIELDCTDMTRTPGAIHLKLKVVR